MEEVRHIFKPEFINRVDEMIVFHVLNKDHIHQITQIMIQGFVKRVKEQMDMDLTVTEEVVDFIAKKGFDKDYGARPIRRAMQTELEDVLAESVIAGEVRMGDAVEAVLEKDGEKERVVTKKFTKNV